MIDREFEKHSEKTYPPKHAYTPTWEETYMKLANYISERSKSRRLQVGAVLIKNNRIISTGYNGLVSGVEPDILEDKDGNTKPDVIHAELNCILSCAREGISVEGSTLYITHSPCLACAALIAQSGISKVIYQTEYRDMEGVNKLKSYGVSVYKSKPFTFV
jgi:dCMP deaminase